VADYTARFGTDPADDFPDLLTFRELGLLHFSGGKWTPTPLGLERSDALGPWFFSRSVRANMMNHELR
jgi:oxygen-independent coproporphyrinogen III oxidase